MLIDVLGWSLVGAGLIYFIFRTFSLTQDANRDQPAGRHSRDRVRPEDLAKEWQQLRARTAAALIGPVFAVSESAKSLTPWKETVRGLAVLVTIAILVWEVRSWRRIPDQADRRRAVKYSRYIIVPLLLQLLGVLPVWHNGTALTVIIIVSAAIIFGPDVEPWIRARLPRRAGGTPPELPDRGPPA